MKYAKPGITLEKFALTNPVLPDAASIQDGPVTEENETVIETSSTLSNAFGEVFDFSQK